MTFLDHLAAELQVLADRGLRRRLRCLEGPQAPRIVLDGRPVLNFSSNDYLGLANAPALRVAAHAALDQDGVGAGAARLIAGNLGPHRQLEAALARFHERPAALLFNSGYQANVGLLPALADSPDVLFSDARNHASLIDGCRLSRARTVVYRHADLSDLEEKLATTPGRFRFVVTDAVFSMDGDLAPLSALRTLADRAGALLLVDEAHATGVLGPAGRGACAAAGVVPDVHLATLSKALGTFGAYVTGPDTLIDFLLHRSRSFVFTTALPPAVAAAARAALELVASAEGAARRASLTERIRQFAAGLARLGWLASGAGTTPIFPILLGDDRRALAASEALLQRGIYAQAIRPPTVPPGTARLRFALTAAHSPQDVDAALAALAHGALAS